MQKKLQQDVERLEMNARKGAEKNVSQLESVRASIAEVNSILSRHGLDKADAPEAASTPTPPHTARKPGLAPSSGRSRKPQLRCFSPGPGTPSDDASGTPTGPSNSWRVTSELAKRLNELQVRVEGMKEQVVALESGTSRMTDDIADVRSSGQVVHHELRQNLHTLEARFTASLESLKRDLLERFQLIDARTSTPVPALTPGLSKVAITKRKKQRAVDQNATRPVSSTPSDHFSGVLEDSSRAGADLRTSLQEGSVAGFGLHSSEFLHEARSAPSRQETSNLKSEDVVERETTISADCVQSGILVAGAGSVVEAEQQMDTRILLSNRESPSSHSDWNDHPLLPLLSAEASERPGTARQNSESDGGVRSDLGVQPAHAVRWFDACEPAASLEQSVVADVALSSSAGALCDQQRAASEAETASSTEGELTDGSGLGLAEQPRETRSHTWAGTCLLEPIVRREIEHPAQQVVRRRSDSSERRVDLEHRLQQQVERLDNKTRLRHEQVECAIQRVSAVHSTFAETLSQTANEVSTLNAQVRHLWEDLSSASEDRETCMIQNISKVTSQQHEATKDLVRELTEKLEENLRASLADGDFIAEQIRLMIPRVLSSEETPFDARWFAMDTRMKSLEDALLEQQVQGESPRSTPLLRDIGPAFALRRATVATVATPLSAPPARRQSQVTPTTRPKSRNSTLAQNFFPATEGGVASRSSRSGTRPLSVAKDTVPPLSASRLSSKMVMEEMLSVDGGDVQVPLSCITNAVGLPVSRAASSSSQAGSHVGDSVTDSGALARLPRERDGLSQAASQSTTRSALAGLDECGTCGAEDLCRARAPGADDPATVPQQDGTCRFESLREALCQAPPAFVVHSDKHSSPLTGRDSRWRLVKPPLTFPDATEVRSRLVTTPTGADAEVRDFEDVDRSRATKHLQLATGRLRGQPLDSNDAHCATVGSTNAQTVAPRSGHSTRRLEDAPPIAGCSGLRQVVNLARAEMAYADATQRPQVSSPINYMNIGEGDGVEDGCGYSCVLASGEHGFSAAKKHLGQRRRAPL